MAGALPEESDMSSVCLKHNANCKKRLYWLLNKLYDNIIPGKNQKRVGALLCTCERRADLPARNDPFLNVSNGDLLNAVAYMETFLITNNRHEHIETLKKMMQWLQDDGLIPANSSARVDNSHIPEAGQRSSALKLLYILQQCLLQNYQFLDPPPPINRQAVSEEMTLTFIADCHHSLIGSIIGRSGSKLKPLLKIYKCHIKVDKVTETDGLKVKVTISKKSQSTETLEKVKKCIEDMVKEVVDDEDHFKDRKRQQDERHKEDFKKLIEETGLMSRTAIWNDIVRSIVSDTRYFSLNRAMGHDALRQWFNEMQADWPVPSSSSGASSGRAFEGGASIMVHNNEFSDEEPDDTVVKGATARPAGMAPDPRTTAIGPVASTSALRPELSSQNGAAGSPTGARISGIFLQPLSTAQGGRLVPEDRASLCLVHDRRWLPTYQFTLTRCYSELHLEKKHGKSFSTFVCSCQYSVPVYLRHFQNEEEMKAMFKVVLEKIKSWPAEIKDVMLPLVRQLEKVQEAEIWHSLYRFVFLFTKLSAGETEYLTSSCRLPHGTADFGEGSIICQPESKDLHRSPSSVPMVTSMGENRSKVTADERSEECYFHGKKKKGPFQCVVNYLHKSANLPNKYRVPFCKAVCCCNEDNNSEALYQTDDDLRRDCKTMKTRLSNWRGDSSVSIQPYIALIQDFLDRNTQLQRGFQKFVYYFNCAYKREYHKFDRR